MENRYRVHTEISKIELWSQWNWMSGLYYYAFFRSRWTSPYHALIRIFMRTTYRDLWRDTQGARRVIRRNSCSALCSYEPISSLANQNSIILSGTIVQRVYSLIWIRSEKISSMDENIRSCHLTLIRLYILQDLSILNYHYQVQETIIVSMNLLVVEQEIVYFQRLYIDR